MECSGIFTRGCCTFLKRRVTPCSREPKCKTLKEERPRKPLKEECPCKTLKEECPCKTLKEERPVFSYITLKVSREGSWPDVVKDISDFMEGMLL
ncbi:hypothetical protein Tco_0623426 [Tanacetum coccineum]